MSVPADKSTALYLPGVEANSKPGVYKQLIDAARARNAEYSKIWDLFAFQPSVTVHLSALTQGVMRAPASISPAFRELIAACTSYHNACAFCTKAHAAAASELLGSEELVWTSLRDLDRAELPDKEKNMLRFVAQMTKDLPSVTRRDVESLRLAGWDDEAIYYAITTCALFNFYNRWITATGVPEMSPEAHREQGRGLAARGYVRE